MDIRCAICEERAFTTELPTGWRRMWIDNFDQLFTSADLRKGVTGFFGMVAVEEADACGQTHALVLTERYLERGTFAPADFHTATVEEGPFDGATL